MLPLDQLESILKEGQLLTEEEAWGIIKENLIDGSVLRQAAKEGFLNVVKFIVGARTRFKLSFEEKFKCSNEGAEDENKNTPLHIAASKGHVSIVEHFISTGTFISLKNRYNETALYLACREGHENMVKFLVRHGVKVCSRNEKMAIVVAISKGWTEIVKYLLDAGADKDDALFHAARKGLTDIVTLILQQMGVSKAALTLSFHESCRWGQLRVCNLLIDAGADVSVTYFDKAPIHVASSTGNLNIVELLVSLGVDVDSLSAQSKTPLFFASQGGHLSIVQFLLDKNAQMAVSAREGLNPLNAAIEAGHIAVARLLLSRGAVFNKEHALKKVMRNGRFLALQCLLALGVDVNSLQYTSPLLLACERNRLEMVRYLLQSNASLDARDVALNTPLHIACKHTGSENVVKLLIACGASVNASNIRGQTPLFGTSDFAVMKMLIDCGTDPNIADVYGRTVLHYTKTNELFNLLLQCAALIDSRDSFGRTPLHYACLRGSKNITKLLLEYGASVNTLDRRGCSPLKEALDQKQTQVAEILLENDADANSRLRVGGPTVLHLTSRTGYAEGALLLLNWGAGVNVVDENGNTPLHAAVVAESFRMVQLLTDYGADVNAVNSHGQSPLHLASKGGIAEILLQGGADTNLEDSGGQTPLHVAQTRKRADVFSVLQTHDGVCFE